MERKRYSRKFQRMAVARMETCEDVGELARELGVRPRCLYKWRRKLEMVEPGQEASRPSTHASAHRKEIHRLKQLLAEKTLEVDFFKGALQRCLYKWRRKLEMVEPGQEASRPSTHASAHRKEIHRLKQLLAEKTLEVDFFKGALQKVEARRQKRGGTGETASTSRSEK